jgi:hypothetical protein
MQFTTDRRGALATLGAGIVASSLTQPARADTLEPAGAASLRDLTRELAALPRRRDYKTVPLILDSPDTWDAAALNAVLAYKSGPKQAWDNTDLTGSWLNGMRNTLNTMVWGFKEANFLCVSATHGPAHLALYDQATWDKYQLAKIAGGNVTNNRFIQVPAAASHDPADIQALEGAF